MLESEIYTGVADFETVFLELREKLLRHAYLNVYDKDDAADIVQKTYIRARAGWSGRNPTTNPKPWLYRVQDFVIKDFRRAESRRLADCAFDEIISAVEQNEDVLDLEASIDVRNMLGKLTPADAGLLVLKDVEGLAWAEIAMLTGRTVGHLRHRYKVAKEIAKKVLTN